MSETKTIVLTVVRHGQTDANKERLVQGFTDTPLNDVGDKQAELAGKAMKDVFFHQAYSSDLKRALKTCQHILDQNKASEITSNDIVQDKRVREQNFGIHENIPLDQWVEMALKEKTDPLDFPPESGETNVEVRNRTREFLKNIISKAVNINYEQPNILVVSHGLTIRQLIKIFFEENGCVSKAPNFQGNLNELLAARKFRDTCLNTCWSKFVIEVTGENYEVIKHVECHEMFNAKHLKELK